jgi:hypothetical protein
MNPAINKLTPERRARLDAMIAKLREIALAGQVGPTNEELGAMLGLTHHVVQSIILDAVGLGLIKRVTLPGYGRVISAGDGSWATAAVKKPPQKRAVTSADLLGLVEAIRRFDGAPCPSDETLGRILGRGKCTVSDYIKAAVDQGLLARRTSKQSARVLSAPDGSWSTLSSFAHGGGYRAAFDRSTGVAVAISHANKGTALSPKATKQKAYLHSMRVLAAPPLTREQEAEAVARFLAEKGPTMLPARCCAPVNNGTGL